MAEEKGTSTSYRDMLDIIFANRNKKYGAYQLRRDYPAHLGRALLYGGALILFLFFLPTILNTVTGVLAKKEKPVDVVAELGPPPDIDPNNPPPPPPPPPPTPPPPTRSTVAFVPPVVKKDIEVNTEEIQNVEKVLDTKADVGKQDKEGNDEAPPDKIDNPTKIFDDGPKKTVVEEKTYELFDIQKQPSFQGGEPELMKYLAENIKYPPLARENNITGVVAISFVVNKDGRVSDVQVLKDIGGGCGKEAQRVVNEMPKWIPGEANGHPVKVRYTLPVRFQLQ
ncbi:MAG: TonB family protein [Lewinellaceae bacterium]|nr:TonB family protein [Lewinellaceae bacterium]